MEIISRQEAISRGLKGYFTGKPCNHGHIAERIVSNSRCFECARIADREFKVKNRERLNEKAREYFRSESRKENIKQYYLINKERYRENSARRYREKRDEILARQKQRLAENPELRSERSKKYRLKNPDKVREIQRNNYVKNRERILARHRERYIHDPSKAAAKVALRRSRKICATPPWFGELDEFVWREAADLRLRRESATGVPWAADHMIPLSGRRARGLHVWNNCQVIPASLNLWKHNKLVLTSPGEWIARL